jgi:hypothetical protein
MTSPYWCASPLNIIAEKSVLQMFFQSVSEKTLIADSLFGLMCKTGFACSSDKSLGISLFLGTKLPLPGLSDVAVLFMLPEACIIGWASTGFLLVSFFSQKVFILFLKSNFSSFLQIK